MPVFIFGLSITAIRNSRLSEREAQTPYISTQKLYHQIHVNLMYSHEERMGLNACVCNCAKNGH